MIAELMHHAQKVPSLPLGKMMDINDLVNARSEMANPPSWIAIFLRAYALVAQQIPELRRTYIPLPYKHLYEHPYSEGTVLIERELQRENIVLGARIRAPEGSSLKAIDDLLRYFRQTPLGQIGFFRQMMLFGRLPWFIRRFTLWHTLYISGYKKAKRLGTFSLSSLGNMGVEQYHPLTPLSTYLTYGPINSAGETCVKVIYDHRVMDGRTVARALQELEKTLQTVLLREICLLRTRMAA
jgi:hypothetical protein